MEGKSRFAFLLLLLVWGCYQRFDAIQAVDSKDGLAFEFPALAAGLSDKRTYEILDLMVTSDGCGSYCTHWDIVSPPGARSANLTGARIAYGEAVPRTVVRTPARALTPGIYTVGATVQEYGADGELVRSLSTRADFELHRDSSGRLRSKSHDKSAKKGGCQ